jgi:hypothetical protein
MSHRAGLIAEMQLLVTAALVLALGWSAYAQQQGEIKRERSTRELSQSASLSMIRASKMLNERRASRPHLDSILLAGTP